MSKVFFKAEEILWLYSGVTGRYPSASFIIVRSFFNFGRGSVISLYILSRRGKSSSTGSMKKTMWFRSFSFCSNHLATFIPCLSLLTEPTINAILAKIDFSVFQLFCYTLKWLNFFQIISTLYCSLMRKIRDCEGGIVFLLFVDKLVNTSQNYLHRVSCMKQHIPFLKKLNFGLL